MTNRDRLNQISNADLATILNTKSCFYCKYADKNEKGLVSICGLIHKSKKCLIGVEEWLESEVE